MLFLCSQVYQRHANGVIYIVPNCRRDLLFPAVDFIVPYFIGSSDVDLFLDYIPSLVVVQRFNTTRAEGIQHLIINGSDYIIEISR